MNVARADYPALTGLRAIAAAVVFINHIGYLVGSTDIGEGWRAIAPLSLSGVFVFFVLSGFLLSSPGSMRGGSRQFWRRRAARILPVYWLALAASILLLSVLDPSRLGPGGLVSNALLLQSWDPVGQAASYNLPAWSLSIELLFYAVLPLVLPATDRWLREHPRAGLATILLGCAVGSAALQLGMVPETFPPAYLPIFFLGVHAASVRRPLTTPAISWMTFTLGALSYPLIENYTLPALGAAVLIPSLAHTGGPSWLAGRTARTLGVWSYAFFLLHVPVVDGVAIVFTQLVGHIPGGAMGGCLIALGAFVVSWAAAGIVYRWGEEPARKWLTESAMGPQRKVRLQSGDASAESQPAGAGGVEHS